MIQTSVSRLILVTMIGLISSLASAKDNVAKVLPKAKPISTMGVIDGESDSNMSAVNIRFLTKPNWQTLPEFEDHGSFLQLNLPNVMVPEPGKFIDGNSIYIKKIAVFQMTPNDASVRLFLSKSAGTIKKALKSELLGNRVVVTLDHKKLLQVIAAPTPQLGIGAKTITNQTSTSAKDVIANTKVDTSIPAPAAAIKADTAIIGKATPDFKKQMINVSLFCGALLLVFLSTLLIRPFLKKRRMTQNEESIEMKTIGTLVLASKQKLSLVQIGDEKILLGVTPENISFITTVSGGNKVTIPKSFENTPSPSDFAGLLQEPAPKFAAAHREPAQKEAPMEPIQQAAALKKRSPTQTPKPAPRSASTNSDLVMPRVPTKPSRIGASKGSQINIGVGDEGVMHADTMNANIQSSRTKIKKGDENAQAIEDVTRLIRNKLKTLKSL